MGLPALLAEVEVAGDVSAGAWGAAVAAGVSAEEVDAASVTIGLAGAVAGVAGVPATAVAAAAAARVAAGVASGVASAIAAGVTRVARLLLAAMTAVKLAAGVASEEGEAVTRVSVNWEEVRLKLPKLAETAGRVAVGSPLRAVRNWVATEVP